MTRRILAAALAGTVALAPAALPAPAGAATARTAAAVPRVIAVDGAANVRDIGGYAAASGRHVRYGLVYRAATLSKVTPAGVRALAGLRLTAAVDFRSTGEIASDGKDRLPAGVTPVAAPINAASASLLDLGPALANAVAAPDKSAAFMELSYRGFIHDPASRARFAATLRRIAAGKGPVLYHCTAGKDRTGTMTAILLTLLGVDRATVYRDFLRSNAELAAGNAATEAKLRAVGIDPAFLVPFLTVRRSYLDAAFDQIRRDYGSFDAFAARGLGVDAATRAALRNRLLR
ncbi:tyrosine-protein phosphatase [Actinomadura parmotrematis]|uniref:Tyrosine-protein phosphatase n=1 Tax=Actinomadura parmotrematis TaxID=2864039 RepID=A0ABS7FMY3_9ACTN|nr:tyrosine-protein phosphatase [Actinomadura parmotrematis]MBW8481742.1 tyrosine-protein phosphatase [Actinomadura parmotrematis]